MIKILRPFLTRVKNENIAFYYMWTLFNKYRAKYELNKLTDKQSIIRRYRKLSGKEPDLDNPLLFSEKMQWLKLNYHDPLMEICADKELVRNWVEEKGYPHILNESIYVSSSLKSLDIDSLPNKFVLKATHGSGWNIVVKDKSKVNWWWWKKIFNVWLSSEIYWEGREWVYKNLKPKLICEKFLEDSSGSLMDYKIHCFGGQPKFIQVNLGRGKEDHIQNFYDISWSFQPFGKNIQCNKNVNINPPSQLEEMLSIATDLSSYFPYARVDFYEVNRKVIFGEITFFPASGYPDFSPIEYDKVWGEMLVLPKTNK